MPMIDHKSNPKPPQFITQSNMLIARATLFWAPRPNISYYYKHVAFKVLQNSFQPSLVNFLLLTMLTSQTLKICTLFSIIRNLMSKISYLKQALIKNECLLSHCFDKPYIPRVGNTCQTGSRQGIKAMSFKNSDGIRVGWIWKCSLCLTSPWCKTDLTLLVPR